MSLYWNPWTLPALGVFLAMAGLAIVVFRAGPGHLRNRLLAATLYLDGGTGLLFALAISSGTPSAAYAAGVTEWVVLTLALAAYVGFLGTLDTPLSRPLAGRIGRTVLVVGTILFSGLIIVRPDLFIAGVVPTPYARWHLVLAGGLGSVFVLGTLAVHLFGLAVAVSYLRRSPPGSPRRSQAWAYLAAFGIRDASVGASWGLFFLLSGSDFSPLTFFKIWFFLWVVGMVGYSLFLTYGFLKHELLDIDLKIKHTVKQGTVVVALVAVYILTSLGARSFMSASAAQTLGVVLTGLLLFALVPLQRFGGRMADAAMPGVRDDEAYLDQRRIEMYRAALEDALRGGGDIAPTDEDRLVRLRANLGLTDRDHSLLLHGVRQPGGSALVPIFEPGRTVLGRYRIDAVLGKGGQGTTYKVLDTTLGRDVVLKVLHGTEPRAFLKEAQALARIDHPNVVTIHDVERIGDHVYIIMEHVDGGSLKEMLGSGTLEQAPFRRLASEILSGLGAVHHAGLVHRDVKPSNVLLNLDRRAKLADLGIATTLSPSEQTTLGAGSTSARGTVAYMSPEQARGDKLTPASDVFSAAATLYEAYTGRPLFKLRPGESSVELQARVAGWSGFDEELGDPSLEMWFARALAPSPQDRYENAAVMRSNLQRSVVEDGSDNVEARPSGHRGVR